MSLHPSFLSFPGELRNYIYYYYVLEPDGYHFNYEAGKLRASNRPVNLGLMFTCKTIASEMHDLAFKLNTITFSTVSLVDSGRLRAGRFDRMMAEIDRCTCNSLRLMVTTKRFFRNPEVANKLSQKCPQFAWVFENLDKLKLSMITMPTYAQGEALSVHREFIHSALELLSKHPRFTRRDGFLARLDNSRSSVPGTDLSTFVRSPLLFSNPNPWAIPSEAEVAEMEKILCIPQTEASQVNDPFENNEERDGFWKRIKWRYSACAACVYFLNSIPLSTRFQIRNIVLCEDRLSIAQPECHTLGLIQFCLENPRLSVERRVNLWRNVLQAGPCRSLYNTVHYPGEEGSWRNDDLDRVGYLYISCSFYAWITEALALSAAGMPSNSFSLVFDGDPVPNSSSEFFEIVKREAAWLAAVEKQGIEESERAYYLDMRAHPLHRFEGFPQAIADMVENKSFIRCNFPIGGL